MRVDVFRACAPCACCHERACELTSRVRVRRVRVVASAMDLRSISGRYINLNTYINNMHILIYNYIINRNSIAMLEREQYSYVSISLLLLRIMNLYQQLTAGFYDDQYVS